MGACEVGHPRKERTVAGACEAVACEDLGHPQ